ncbi:hypothetical protein [Streptodolium elevatio]|uniref:Uncharacterized protein n=1 Tax=Streptodolium elevatio TaxID=3157996 RepID=A0ABV3DSB9_9ACTN
MAISMPSQEQLPPGPRRDLVMSFHQLYTEAGRPGTRKLAKLICDNNDLGAMVSHETIAALLHGRGVPSWIRLEACVRQLAQLSIRQPDVRATVLDFHTLWRLAADAPPPADTAPDDAPSYETATVAELAASLVEHSTRADLGSVLEAIHEEYGVAATDPAPRRLVMHAARTASRFRRDHAEALQQLEAARQEIAELKKTVRRESVMAVELRDAMGKVWTLGRRIPDAGELFTELYGLGEEEPVPYTLLLEIVRRLASASPPESLPQIVRDDPADHGATMS